MSRIARVVVPEVPFHVTQRGNNHQAVFLSDSDREEYLCLLGKRIEKTGAEIIAYCLMDNHVHFIVFPHSATDLADTFGRVHCVYALRFNARYERNGHLWQNRFFSCALDQEHLEAAVRYVELNPVRAGMLECPWEYPWSSARPHVLGVLPPVSLADADRFGMQSGLAWKMFLAGGLGDIELESIRSSTRKGLPLGEQAFVERVEDMVARDLSSGSAGRPGRGARR